MAFSSSLGSVVGVKPDWSGFRAEREKGNWRLQVWSNFQRIFVKRKQGIEWKLIEEVGQNKFYVVIF